MGTKGAWIYGQQGQGQITAAEVGVEAKGIGDKKGEDSKQRDGYRMMDGRGHVAV